MQKTLKRLAVILLALTACLLVAFSFTACGGATDYNVTVVYEDGKAVDGTKDGVNPFDAEMKTVTVQICLVDGQCYATEKLDASGKATLKAPDYTLKEGEEFKLQVNNVPEGYKCDSSRIYVWTTHVTKPGNYTIKLEKV